MEHYVKKYFWVGTVVVVIVCAAFAAEAVNHYISAKYLPDSAEPARVDTSRVRRAPVKTVRTKEGGPLADRNIFCSTCEPVEPEQPGEDTETLPPGTVPLTSLPLELLATNVGSRENYSFATIRNTDSSNQGAYWVEDSIPGAGKVTKIAPKYVEFENTQKKRTERIALFGSEPPKRPVASTAPRTPPRRTVGGDDMASKLDDGIKKVDDSNFEIDRDLVNELLENPMAVARGARIVPSIKNGKANGFKLYAIRPSSVYAKLGMMNGDTIHAVNGFELTTPDKALEVYTKVRESSNLSISVTRRGKPVTINYSIR
jgi:general secretion pathway protein C